jgi:hypothetical protein
MSRKGGEPMEHSQLGQPQREASTPGRYEHTGCSPLQNPFEKISMNCSYAVGALICDVDHAVADREPEGEQIGLSRGKAIAVVAETA